jgi:surface antigen
MRKIALLFLLALAASWAAEAFADPPPQAPAHGWRKKHDRYYVGYTGTRWDRDYDVSSGRCNREEIGAVLGGVVGGVIGSQVGSRDNRTVATIIGAAVGALIGAKIGRDMDDEDRACFGHALEIGSTGRRVVWDNRSSGVHYVLVPGVGARTRDGVCRDFTLYATRENNRWTRKGRACQTDPGVWKIM